MGEQWGPHPHRWTEWGVCAHPRPPALEWAGLPAPGVPTEPPAPPVPAGRAPRFTHPSAAGQGRCMRAGGSERSFSSPASRAPQLFLLLVPGGPVTPVPGGQHVRVSFPSRQFEDSIFVLPPQQISRKAELLPFSRGVAPPTWDTAAAAPAALGLAPHPGAPEPRGGRKGLACILPLLELPGPARAPADLLTVVATQGPAASLRQTWDG